MKIRIIGRPGSGKSYLGAKLSAKLNTKHYKLDIIEWDPRYNWGKRQIPISKRKSKLDKILKQRSWIIEGWDYSWSKESFKQANLIILLNPTPSKCYFNLIMRFFKQKLGLIPAKKKKFKDLPSILNLCKTYDTKKMTSALKRHSKKINNYSNADKALKQF